MYLRYRSFIAKLETFANQIQKPGPRTAITTPKVDCCKLEFEIPTIKYPTPANNVTRNRKSNPVPCFIRISI